MSMPGDWHYSPQIFLNKNLEEAKAIILTPEAGMTPDQRWEKETSYLMGKIAPHARTDGIALDYGCGVGRLAKLLPMPVLGVDISPTMRAMAEGYVGRPDFATCSPPALTALASGGLKCSFGYSVWVLQHCLDVEWDIRNLARVLHEDATFITVNRNHRAVPLQDNTKRTAWWDDGIDIDVVLRQFFDMKDSAQMPPDLCAPGALITTWQRNGFTVDMGAPRLVHVVTSAEQVQR